VLALCFQLGFVDYGQLIEIEKNGGVGKEKLVVYGESVLGDIEATVVGNFNGVLCVCLGRLVGGCKCFSRVKCRLVCVVGLFLFYWNFINGFKCNVSRAKLEGLADHLWTWREFFYTQISILN